MAVNTLFAPQYGTAWFKFKAWLCSFNSKLELSKPSLLDPEIADPSL